jgi:hypothetical protein
MQRNWHAILNSLTPAANRATLELRVIAYNGRSIWPSLLASQGWGAQAVAIRSCMLVMKASIWAAVLAGFAELSFASCGDWLAHAPVPPSTTALRDRGSDSAPIAGRTSSGVDRQQLPLLPCSGPSCRSAPPIPDLPLPPLTTISLAEFAIASSTTPALAGMQPLGIAASVDARCTRGFPERVEHPPRA